MLCSMPAEPSAVTVALANDYEVVVRGLEQMVAVQSERIRVIELDLNMPVGQPVDVTLWDSFSQPQVDGADIDRVIASDWSGRVVVYTWNVQPALVSTALEKGVAGYLSKTLSAEELVDALERVHRGEVVVFTGDPGDEPGEDEDREPREVPMSGDWPGREEGLTAREAEVVALITQGLSNQEIAERSYLSINSVKSYIKAAYRKASTAAPRPCCGAWITDSPPTAVASSGTRSTPSRRTRATYAAPSGSSPCASTAFSDAPRRAPTGRLSLPHGKGAPPCHQPWSGPAAARSLPASVQPSPRDLGCRSCSSGSASSSSE
jgi:DNA-binding NarL/FixJ family response regulator